jgi:formiminoglutamase
MNSMGLTSGSTHLWRGRSSETLQYWHQAINFPDLTKPLPDANQPAVALLGYAGDEGVSRNQGRPGASAGPDAIRQQLGPIAYHLPENLQILDLGNVGMEKGMEECQNILTSIVEELLGKHYFPLLLGGGHELSFAHGRAVINHFKTKGEKVGIINLDAHFDLRPLQEGKGHSGSPFYQLAKEYPGKFHYLCLGVQQGSNPKSLFDFAESIQAEWLEIESFQLTNWIEIQEQLERFCSNKNKIYLSIDMDGFSSAYAPGVSAPSPLGFDPFLILRVIEWIALSKKLIAMDLVELNPKFDNDQSTAKLAARLVDYLVRNLK